VPFLALVPFFALALVPFLPLLAVLPFPFLPFFLPPAIVAGLVDIAMVAGLVMVAGLAMVAGLDMVAGLAMGVDTGIGAGVLATPTLVDIIVGVFGSGVVASATRLAA
jgi:hypothetical protein